MRVTPLFDTAPAAPVPVLVPAPAPRTDLHYHHYCTGDPGKITVAICTSEDVIKKNPPSGQRREEGGREIIASLSQSYKVFDIPSDFFCLSNLPKYPSGPHFVTMGPITRPKILHLGDEIEYHKDIHTRLLSQFDIIRPNPTNPIRSEFIRHLKDKTWGDFSAIMRPYWNTGNEMRPWDRELIDLLPKSMKVMASAGAGYDWVDVEALAEKGTLHPSRALG